MRKGLVWMLVCSIGVLVCYACSGSSGPAATNAATTYTISGSVTTSTGGLQNVVMTLTGASSETVTTDASGTFSFNNIEDGNYVITPSKTGYAFNPANIALAVNGANISAVNFTAQDNMPPTVLSVIPSNNSISIATDSSIMITFSEPVDAATVTSNNIVLKSGSTLVNGTLTLSGNSVNFVPSALLQPYTNYSLEISGIKDIAGNAMSATYSSSFTTGGPSVATHLSGIINMNTTLLKANSPYIIDDKLQVADGVTLSLEPGVEIYQGSNSASGHYVIEVWGSISAIGSSNSVITFRGVEIQPGSTAINANINLDYTKFTYGSPFINYNAGAASLVLRNSVLNNAGLFLKSTLSADCYIEKNIFKNSPSVYLPFNAKNIFITYNVFIQTQPLAIDQFSYAIEVWGGSTIIAQYNSFLTTDKLAVSLPAGHASNSSIVTTNNYWSTNNTATIDAMIYDKNDNLGSPSIVIYQPILTSADPNTPDATPYLN